jgi:hypothetical protein
MSAHGEEAMSVRDNATLEALSTRSVLDLALWVRLCRFRKRSREFYRVVGRRLRAVWHGENGKSWQGGL